MNPLSQDDFRRSASSQGAPMRLGIVGVDTSHAPAFTELFNGAHASGDWAGVRVVAALPAPTSMPASRERVEGFTARVQALGVEIVRSLPELLERVDGVLIQNVDGRVHLQRAREIFPFVSRVFIDKPMAGSLAEVLAIFELARRYGVACWSASATRFGPDLCALKEHALSGPVLGVSTWGPCAYQEGAPDLLFYGIHGIEALFTLMGRGCASVVRLKGAAGDVSTGCWSDGRIGTYRGLVQGKAEFGALVYGGEQNCLAGKLVGYEPICRRISRFFTTGILPVAPEETAEIFAFIEAAERSARLGGVPVALEEILFAARVEAARLL